jgi:hypothetical protein
MATCPQCGRFLDRDHQCAGIWRLRLGVFMRTVGGALVGSVIGWSVTSLVFGSTSSLTVALAAVVGALVTFAWLRGEPANAQG